MDREWPEEKRQHFLAVASQPPESKGIHDLRTRTSGTPDFVQFHVWVDPAMTVAHAHQVMDEVEEKLAAAFPGTERSEARREGKECVSKCRARGSPYQ